MRRKTSWSPVEIEYLKKHKDNAKDQLCIALAKTRSALDKKMAELELVEKNKNPLPVGKQSRVGRREDIGFFVRSGWEANMYRYFNSSFSKYQYLAYEPDVFSFTLWEKPKGQALSYTPDFKVRDSKTDKEYWVEVKGNWLRPHDKTKLRRFKKHFPKEFAKLIAVVSSKNTKTAEFFRELGVPERHLIEYNQLNKEFKNKIPHWE